MAAVNYAAISSDGRRVISAGADKTIRLWDVKSGQEIQRVETPESIWGITTSQDGRFVLFGSAKTTMIGSTTSTSFPLTLWDTESGEKIRFSEAPDNFVNFLEFSADTRQGLCATGSEVWLLNLAEGRIQQRFTELPGPINGVAFSPDGPRALVYMAGGVMQWDLQGRKELWRIKGVVNPALQISPDGRRALSVGISDPTVQLWDIGAGRQIRKFVGHEGLIFGATFSPDGRRFLSYGLDGIRLWDVESGQMLHFWNDHEGRVSRAVFAGNGDWLLSCGSDETVRLRQIPANLSAPNAETAKKEMQR